MVVPDLGRAPGSGRAVPTDHLRLLARVARMYHEQGMRQPEIAATLSISQPRVSRLLKEAIALGIVRTVVVLPEGVHTELEEELQRRYGLRDAVVVDTAGATDDVIPALGAAAASYFNTTFKGGDVIGISSWSETLLAAVERMQPKSTQVADRVMQVVGGVGSPDAQVHATRLLGRLADVTRARPIFVPSAGVVGTATIRDALLQDSAVKEVMAQWRDLTVVLVGIGSLEPSPLLLRSGNAVSDADQAELRALGAVGDVCLHFFDAEGAPVDSAFDHRVVGIDVHTFRAVERRVAVAGGARKYSAIKAALKGAWINVLITDLDTATRLTTEP
ncbi:DNA-binding transcriptional regulator LsrR (DeoR family) [Thermocatellispora tengchongensis]|uniref:DNA-binding transcriptional regulator LsrR (DeoR family) n=1 Tax=Thermocatellispora tengchongensis TaxID=1073253 RepID=A0A840P9X1_9ACTN|nr:sugar-binding transcriptional regulator [Thermocatellispora tengchongensis]MBB5136448.1 DNA-binding transcriptional regulator LsrR (DeoR family) [Thermocatellispora tengchongensis]